MPEILEIELYRRAAAATVGRTIEALDTPDPDWVGEPGPAAVAQQLTGARVNEVRRHGKVLFLDTDGGVLGLRFGMTGRLVVDGRPVIDVLEYSSPRLDPKWDRFGVRFDDGSLAVNDPRRLGAALLDPELKLGVDAWRIAAGPLRTALRGRRAVKAVLLDQSRVAGLGNLLADEALSRAAIDPRRPADEIIDDEVARLGEVIVPMLEELIELGGSTSGRWFSARSEGARCPDDGGPMVSAMIGGRRTWWCSEHQR